jgi:hypothetical protein
MVAVLMLCVVVFVLGLLLRWIGLGIARRNERRLVDHRLQEMETTSPASFFVS